MRIPLSRLEAEIVSEILRDTKAGRIVTSQSVVYASPRHSDTRAQVLRALIARKIITKYPDGGLSVNLTELATEIARRELPRRLASVMAGEVLRIYRFMAISTVPGPDRKEVMREYDAIASRLKRKGGQK